MPSASNHAVIAAAGASKTAFVIDQALATPDERVLITTYTNENIHQISSRIRSRCNGVIPRNVTVISWFSFLLNQCARPYQSAVLQEINKLGSLNFHGLPLKFARKADAHRYFLDSNSDIYRDYLSDFCCTANNLTGGKVIGRLEAMFDHVLIDEVQDFVGYDLDILDLLFASRIRVTAVGDPRQHTFSTNNNQRNKKYKGPGLLDWFNERSSVCTLDLRTSSQRCCQDICDLADKIFPSMPRTTADNSYDVPHTGVFYIKMHEVHEYINKWNPTVVRWSRATNTLGQPAINVGVSKGSTYDRVLIFPTPKWARYLTDGDHTKLKAPEKLYVAITRARYSVAIVMP